MFYRGRELQLQYRVLERTECCGGLKYERSWGRLLGLTARNRSKYSLYLRPTAMQAMGVRGTHSRDNQRCP